MTRNDCKIAKCKDCDIWIWTDYNIMKKKLTPKLLSMTPPLPLQLIPVQKLVAPGEGSKSCFMFKLCPISWAIVCRRFIISHMPYQYHKFSFTSDSCKSLKTHELMLILTVLPLLVPPLTLASSFTQTVPPQAIPTSKGPPPLGGSWWVMKTIKLESSSSSVSFLAT